MSGPCGRGLRRRARGDHADELDGNACLLVSWMRGGRAPGRRSRSGWRDSLGMRRRHRLADGASRRRFYARVPTDTRYSCSKRARSGVPRFHSSQNCRQRVVELLFALVAAPRSPGRRWWAVARLEVLAVVVRALEGGDVEHLPLVRPEVDAVAEQPAQVLLAAPQRRRLRARRRRRREGPHRAEQRADHALGRPAEQPDRAARAAHAHELVGRLLVVRREHDADRRHDDVERLVLERQVLGVGLDPLELEALRLRAPATRLQQLRRQVAGRDVRAALRGRDRGVAGAGGDVEDAHPGTDPARLDESRPDRQQERLDHGRVVTRGPHRAVAGLELGIRRWTTKLPLPC